MPPANTLLQKRYKGDLSVLTEEEKKIHNSLPAGLRTIGALAIHPEYSKVGSLPIFRKLLNENAFKTTVLDVFRGLHTNLASSIDFSVAMNSLGYPTMIGAYRNRVTNKPYSGIVADIRAHMHNYFFRFIRGKNPPRSMASLVGLPNQLINSKEFKDEFPNISDAFRNTEQYMGTHFRFDKGGEYQYGKLSNPDLVFSDEENGFLLSSVPEGINQSNGRQLFYRIGPENVLQIAGSVLDRTFEEPTFAYGVGPIILPQRREAYQQKNDEDREAVDPFLDYKHNMYENPYVTLGPVDFPLFYMWEKRNADDEEYEDEDEVKVDGEWVVKNADEEWKQRVQKRMEKNPELGRDHFEKTVPKIKEYQVLIFPANVTVPPSEPKNQKKVTESYKRMVWRLHTDNRFDALLPTRYTASLGEPRNKQIIRYNDVGRYDISTVASDSAYRGNTLMEKFVETVRPKPSPEESAAINHSFQRGRDLLLSRPNVFFERDRLSQYMKKDGLQITASSNSAKSFRTPMYLRNSTVERQALEKQISFKPLKDYLHSDFSKEHNILFSALYGAQGGTTNEQALTAHMITKFIDRDGVMDNEGLMYERRFDETLDQIDRSVKLAEEVKKSNNSNRDFWNKRAANAMKKFESGTPQSMMNVSRPMRGEPSSDWTAGRPRPIFKTMVIKGAPLSDNVNEKFKNFLHGFSVFNEGNSETNKLARRLVTFNNTNDNKEVFYNVEGHPFKSYSSGRFASFDVAKNPPKSLEKRTKRIITQVVGSTNAYNNFLTAPFYFGANIGDYIREVPELFDFYGSEGNEIYSIDELKQQKELNYQDSDPEMTLRTINSLFDAYHIAKRSSQNKGSHHTLRERELKVLNEEKGKMEADKNPLYKVYERDGKTPFSSEWVSSWLDDVEIAADAVSKVNLRDLLFEHFSKNEFVPPTEPIPTDPIPGTDSVDLAKRAINPDSNVSLREYIGNDEIILGEGPVPGLINVTILRKNDEPNRKRGSAPNSRPGSIGNSRIGSIAPHDIVDERGGDFDGFNDPPPNNDPPEGGPPEEPPNNPDDVEPSEDFHEPDVPLLEAAREGDGGGDGPPDGSSSDEGDVDGEEEKEEEEEEESEVPQQEAVQEQGAPIPHEESDVQRQEAVQEQRAPPAEEQPILDQPRFEREEARRPPRIPNAERQRQREETLRPASTGFRRRNLEQALVDGDTTTRRLTSAVSQQRATLARSAQEIERLTTDNSALRLRGDRLTQEVEQLRAQIAELTEQGGANQEEIQRLNAELFASNNLLEKTNQVFADVLGTNVETIQENITQEGFTEEVRNAIREGNEEVVRAEAERIIDETHPDFRNYELFRDQLKNVLHNNFTTFVRAYNEITNIIGQTVNSLNPEVRYPAEPIDIPDEQRELMGEISPNGEAFRSGIIHRISAGFQHINAFGQQLQQVSNARLEDYLGRMYNALKDIITNADALTPNGAELILGHQITIDLLKPQGKTVEEFRDDVRRFFGRNWRLNLTGRPDDYHNIGEVNAAAERAIKSREDAAGRLSGLAKFLGRGENPELQALMDRQREQNEELSAQIVAAGEIRARLEEEKRQIQEELDRVIAENARLRLQEGFDDIRAQNAALEERMRAVTESERKIREDLERALNAQNAADRALASKNEQLQKIIDERAHLVAERETLRKEREEFLAQENAHRAALEAERNLRHEAQEGARVARAAEAELTTQRNRAEARSQELVGILQDMTGTDVTYQQIMDMYLTDREGFKQTVRNIITNAHLIHRQAVAAQGLRMDQAEAELRVATLEQQIKVLENVGAVNTALMGLANEFVLTQIPGNLDEEGRQRYIATASGELINTLREVFKEIQADPHTFKDSMTLLHDAASLSYAMRYVPILLEATRIMYQKHQIMVRSLAARYQNDPETMAQLHTELGPSLDLTSVWRPLIETAFPNVQGKLRQIDLNRIAEMSLQFDPFRAFNMESAFSALMSQQGLRDLYDQTTGKRVTAAQLLNHETQHAIDLAQRNESELRHAILELNQVLINHFNIQDDQSLYGIDRGEDGFLHLRVPDQSIFERLELERENVRPEVLQRDIAILRREIDVNSYLVDMIKDKFGIQAVTRYKSLLDRSSSRLVDLQRRYESLLERHPDLRNPGAIAENINDYFQRMQGFNELLIAYYNRATNPIEDQERQLVAMRDLESRITMEMSTLTRDALNFNDNPEMSEMFKIMLNQLRERERSMKIMIGLKQDLKDIQEAFSAATKHSSDVRKKESKELISELDRLGKDLAETLNQNFRNYREENAAELATNLASLNAIYRQMEQIKEAAEKNDADGDIVIPPQLINQLNGVIEDITESSQRIAASIGQAQVDAPNFNEMLANLRQLRDVAGIDRDSQRAIDDLIHQFSVRENERNRGMFFGIPAVNNEQVQHFVNGMFRNEAMNDQINQGRFQQMQNELQNMRDLLAILIARDNRANGTNKAAYNARPLRFGGGFMTPMFGRRKGMTQRRAPQKRQRRNSRGQFTTGYSSYTRKPHIRLRR